MIIKYMRIYTKKQKQKKQGPPGYVAVLTVDNDWQMHEDIDKDKKGPPGRVAVLTVAERVRWLVPAK